MSWKLWRSKDSNADDTDYAAGITSPSADLLEVLPSEGKLQIRAFVIDVSGDLVARGSMTFTAQILEVSTDGGEENTSELTPAATGMIPGETWVENDAVAIGRSRFFYLRLSDIANEPGSFESLEVYVQSQPRR